MGIAAHAGSDRISVKIRTQKKKVAFDDDIFKVTLFCYSVIFSLQISDDISYITT